MYSIPNRLLFSILVLVPLYASAETVYLKDGSSITGQIKSVRPEEVIVDTVIGEIKIDSTKILKVEKDAVTPEAAPVKSNSEMRLQQPNGFGFGPALSAMLGINLFYDHNLGRDSQLHVQVNGSASSRATIYGENVLKTSRSMILATYRYFPAENKGFYLGAGGGFAHSALTYTSPSSSTPYEYTSNLKGVFVLGEIGWQGIDGYYFNVGFQPAGYITSSDNYDVSKIPNTSNHQTAANEEHDNLKILSQISIGFGWFF